MPVVKYEFNMNDNNNATDDNTNQRPARPNLRRQVASGGPGDQDPPPLRSTGNPPPPPPPPRLFGPNVNRLLTRGNLGPPKRPAYLPARYDGSPAAAAGAYPRGPGVGGDGKPSRYSWAHMPHPAAAGRHPHEHAFMTPFSSAASRVLVVNPMQIVNLSEHTKSRLVKFIEAIKKFSEKWFSHVLLLLFLAVYACLGAYIFISFEASTEQLEKQAIFEARTRIADEMWQLVAPPNTTTNQTNGILDSLLSTFTGGSATTTTTTTTTTTPLPPRIAANNTGVAATSTTTPIPTTTTTIATTTASPVHLTDNPKMTKELFTSELLDRIGNYERMLDKYCQFDLANAHHTLENQWTFWGALFYSMTVFTTIGYGHMTPITFAGRVATMIYALFGIPILLMVLADLGKLLTRIIKYTFKQFRYLFNKLLHRKESVRTRRLITDNTNRYIGVTRDALERGVAYIHPQNRFPYVFDRMNHSMRFRRNNPAGNDPQAYLHGHYDPQIDNNQQTTLSMGPLQQQQQADGNKTVTTDVIVTPTKQTKPVYPTVAQESGAATKKSDHKLAQRSSSSNRSQSPGNSRNRSSRRSQRRGSVSRSSSASNAGSTSKSSSNNRASKSATPGAANQKVKLARLATTETIEDADPNRSPNDATVGDPNEPDIDAIVHADRDDEEADVEVFEDDDDDEHGHEDELDIPVSFALLLLVTYMMLGAVVFSIWEGWTFFEALYFVFISMSTIGFGDLVPQHPKRMIGTFAYLLFGLALTSMCINVVQEKIHATFLRAKMQIGEKMGFDLDQIMADDFYGPDNSLMAIDSDDEGSGASHTNVDSEADPDGAGYNGVSSPKLRPSSTMANGGGGADLALGDNSSKPSGMKLKKRNSGGSSDHGGSSFKRKSSKKSPSSGSSGNDQQSKRQQQLQRHQQHQQQKSNLDRLVSHPMSAAAAHFNRTVMPFRPLVELVRRPEQMSSATVIETKPSAQGTAQVLTKRQTALLIAKDPSAPVKGFCEPLKKPTAGTDNTSDGRPVIASARSQPLMPAAAAAITKNPTPNQNNSFNKITTTAADNNNIDKLSQQMNNINNNFNDRANNRLPYSNSGGFSSSNNDRQQSPFSMPKGGNRSLDTSRRSSVSRELNQLDDLLVALNSTGQVTFDERYGPLLGIPSSVRSSRSSSPVASTPTTSNTSTLTSLNNNHRRGTSMMNRPNPYHLSGRAGDDPDSRSPTRLKKRSYAGITTKNTPSSYVPYSPSSPSLKGVKNIHHGSSAPSVNPHRPFDHRSRTGLDDFDTIKFSVV